MIVFLNGRFVQEDEAKVSVLDRGFLYGDGLFETIRVYQGCPFRWAQHLARLELGAKFLRLRLPLSGDELLRAARELIVRNALPEALLRITVSRGIGPRGYSPKGADQPTLTMTLHPAPAVSPEAPPRWHLITSSFRVPAGEQLAAFKTCNKLPQILARAEAEDRGGDEALLLNTAGELAEAASSNLFWIEGETVCTTPVSSGILAGVTRQVVFEICSEGSIRTVEKVAKVEALTRADGVFLSVSSLEIVEAVALDGRPLGVARRTTELWRAYRDWVGMETGKPPSASR